MSTSVRASIFLRAADNVQHATVARSDVRDEGEDYVETLAYTAMVVAKADDPKRIKDGYDAAQALLARRRKRPVRDRIKACLLQHMKLKERNDFACAGWMLAALELRLSEPGLPNPEKLRVVLDETVQLLAWRTGETRH